MFCWNSNQFFIFFSQTTSHQTKTEKQNLKNVTAGSYSAFKLSTLQIPNSHYEKKNTWNDHIIANFEFFFSCHYSKTFWLAENLNEIKISHYGKIFSHINQNFSFWESAGNTKHFFVSLRLPLFSPRYIALKLNQQIITKISNHLT